MDNILIYLISAAGLVFIVWVYLMGKDFLSLKKEEKSIYDAANRSIECSSIFKFKGKIDIGEERKLSISHVKVKDGRDIPGTIVESNINETEISGIYTYS